MRFARCCLDTEDALALQSWQYHRVGYELTVEEFGAVGYRPWQARLAGNHFSTAALNYQPATSNSERIAEIKPFVYRTLASGFKDRVDQIKNAIEIIGSPPPDFKIRVR